MKVILLENLRKIGNIGDIIEVKRGFARNFLIVNNKALYASKDNIKKVEKIKAELGKKDLEKKRAAKEVEDKIPERIKENLRDVNSSLKSIFKDLIEEF